MNIRPARPADAPLLPAIEQSAAQSFLQIEGLEWLAGHDVLSVEEHLGFIDSGLSWVAVDEADDAVGFVCASVQDDALHIEELSVRHDRQGCGLGRRLIAAVEARARWDRLAGLTLTTFSEVPWNAPFYGRLGFERLDDARQSECLRRQLAHEQALGLPGRCAMSKTLRAPA